MEQHMKFVISAAGILLISATTGFAQEATSQTATVAATPTAQSAVVQTSARLLPASTLVPVTPDTEITSKKVEVGDKFNFSVVNDVLENGTVAIPRGSKVEGTITWKTGKAVGGKSGKFEVTFNKINVRGTDYAMRGVHRQEGKGNTVAAVFATWLVSGRSAVMQPGQFVNAFTVDSIPY
jgi:hypothetical protein